jgi:hypothetical protein
VPGDTPARRATSLMVAGDLPGGIAVASLWSKAPVGQHCSSAPGLAARGRSDRLSIGEEKVVCEVSFRTLSQHLIY